MNLGSIKAIGFDMDHTLAVYNHVNFETLAFEKTLEKFIEAGYPSELRRLQFDPNSVIRGLLVDRELGNLLKVDAHKYVKIAFHGKRRLEKEERHRLYNSQSFKAEKLMLFNRQDVLNQEPEKIVEQAFKKAITNPLYAKEPPDYDEG
jgi:hypothetical protein